MIMHRREEVSLIIKNKFTHLVKFIVYKKLSYTWQEEISLLIVFIPKFLIVNDL